MPNLKTLWRSFLAAVHDQNVLSILTKHRESIYMLYLGEPVVDSMSLKILWEFYAFVVAIDSTSIMAKASAV